MVFGMKIIYVDIDGTICENTKGFYWKANPRYDQIVKINKLYEEGNTIIYYTARGSVTKIDWTKLTKQQLKDWGCRYHELRMNKPDYTLWIDDKSKRIEEL